MNELIQEMLSSNVIKELVRFDGALYVLLAFILLYVAKLLYDLFTPYSLNEQLTEKDNKAVAVAFSGYMLGILIIILGVYSSDGYNAVAENNYIVILQDILSTLVWGIFGILLLNLSRVINDKLILSHFSNTKELITDRNIGTGAVIWGTYIGAALIIRAAIGGEAVNWLIDIVSALIYYVLAQLAFIIYGWIYQWMSRFDLHAEIEKDNIAAGLAFGLSLTAMAIILSGYIAIHDSLTGLLVWFVIGLFLLVVSRYVVDKLVLPGSLLDEEIARDQNWGAALIDGSVALGMAAVIVASLLG